MRTSRISEYSTVLIMAGDSHAAGFAALQTFTAGAILGIFALSNPFSAQAQESKQAIGRLIQLPKSLGYRTTVSDQCGSVLADLLQLIMAEEMKALTSGGLGKIPRYSSSNGSTLLPRCASLILCPKPVSTASQSTRPNEWSNRSSRPEGAFNQSVETCRNSTYSQELDVVSASANTTNFSVSNPVPAHLHNSSMIATGSFNDALLSLQNFSAEAFGPLSGIDQAWIWDDSFQFT